MTSNENEENLIVLIVPMIFSAATIILMCSVLVRFGEVSVITLPTLIIPTILSYVMLVFRKHNFVVILIMIAILISVASPELLGMDVNDLVRQCLIGKYWYCAIRI